MVHFFDFGEVLTDFLWHGLRLNGNFTFLRFFDEVSEILNFLVGNKLVFFCSLLDIKLRNLAQTKLDLLVMGLLLVEELVGNS